MDEGKEHSEQDRQWVAAIAEKEARTCARESARRAASLWLKIILAGVAGFTVCAVFVGYNSAEDFLRQVAISHVDAYFQEKGGERLHQSMGEAERQLGQAQALLDKLNAQEEAFQQLKGLERLKNVERRLHEIDVRTQLPTSYSVTRIVREGNSFPIVAGPNLYHFRVNRIRIDEAIVTVEIELEAGTCMAVPTGQAIVKSKVSTPHTKMLKLQPQACEPMHLGADSVTFSAVGAWKEGLGEVAVIKSLISVASSHEGRTWLESTLEEDTDRSWRRHEEIMNRIREKGSTQE